MLKVLIIEDEKPAASRLTSLLDKCGIDIHITGVTDSIKSSVAFLEDVVDLDLIFMDIQLADGLSFSIFSKIDVKTPVIFTTAYDQYALKAFKVNSIDYLLKPIEVDELCAAIEKHNQLAHQHSSITPSILKAIEGALQGKNYKERFLIKNGGGLSFVYTKDITYFYSEDGLSFGKNVDGKRFVIDETIDALEGLLDPSSFFRINRKMLLQLPAINEIKPYFNNRLVLDLSPPFDEQVLVSRQRVTAFKDWLDG